MFTTKPFGNVLFIAIHGRSSLEGSVVVVVVWTVFFFFRIFDVSKAQKSKGPLSKCEKLWFFLEKLGAALREDGEEREG